MQITNDVNDKTSSKRVAGLVFSAVGLLLLITISIVSMISPLGDAETALTAAKTIAYTGAALLGFGVVEFLQPKGKG